MQFLLSELESLSTQTQEKSFPSNELLGPAPSGIKFDHSVEAKVTTELITGEILVTGNIETIVTYECARCLNEFTKPLSGQFRQTVTPVKNIIDCTNQIRETVFLNLPIKAICKESCKGFCDTCGGNKNIKPCQCHIEQPHPQWDALKNWRTK